MTIVKKKRSISYFDFDFQIDTSLINQYVLNSNDYQYSGQLIFRRDYVNAIN